MKMRIDLIGFIADQPTPKINAGGDVAYMLNSRNHKGVMIVVIKYENDNVDRKEIL